MTVAQVAKHFNVDEVTVHRWLKSGCPCLRPGRRGPGRGALLDIEQVEQWRGRSTVPEGLTVENLLPRIASALCDALMLEHADIRAGIDRAAAAAVLVVAFEQCCVEFKKTYPFNQQPKPIRTLMFEI